MDSETGVNKQEPQIMTVKSIKHRPSSFDPIRINADDQKKWKLVCYVLLIIVLLIIICLVSFLVLPQTTAYLSQSDQLAGTKLSQCSSYLYLSQNKVGCLTNTSSNTSTLTVGTYVQNLQSLNQFLMFYLDIKDKSLLQKNYRYNLNIVFTLYRTYIDDQSNIIATDIIQQSKLDLVGSLHDGIKGGEIFLGFLSKLNQESQFYWEVELSNSSILNSTNSFILQSIVMNSSFTLFTIILRVILFLISLVVFLWYNRIIVLQTPKDRVSIEQRCIQVFGAITLTFNDQFYFITVIYPNGFTTFLSSFFLWNYVFFVFVIWIFFLTRINQQSNDTQLDKIKPVKIGIIIIFYLLVFAFILAFAYSQTEDHPIIYHENLISTPVEGLKIVAFIAFSIAILYIAYLYITVYRKINLKWRNKIFIVVSLAFFIITIVLFFIGGYSIFTYSAPLVMFTLTFMNCYSYFLQYLYCPTSNQLKKMGNAELINLIQSDRANEIPPDGLIQIQLSEQFNSQKQKMSEGSSDKNQGKLSIRQKRKRERKNKSINMPKQQKMSEGQEIQESKQKISQIQ